MKIRKLTDEQRKERKIQSRHEYYLRNKEEISIYNKKWRSRNKEKVNSNAREYVKKKNSLMRKLIANCCEKCKSQKSLCIHHKNRNHFDNSPTNLMILCRKCHAKEHYKDRKINLNGRLK